MRLKTRAHKRERFTRKRKMEHNQDCSSQSVGVDEREALHTFQAHLHLSSGRYWTEDVWEQMTHHYLTLAKKPITVVSLKLAWHQFCLENDLLDSLRSYGIRYHTSLHIFYGASCSWEAAEAAMPDHKDLIEKIRWNVMHNFLLLLDVFEGFKQNPPSSTNRVQGLGNRLVNIEKEVGEMKEKQLANIEKGLEEVIKGQTSIYRRIKKNQERIKRNGEHFNKKLKKLMKMVGTGKEDEEQQFLCKCVMK